MVPQRVSENVSKHLLTCTDSEALQVNYSADLNGLIEEAKQMKLLEKILPETLQVLAGERESLWYVRAKLSEVCEEYNEFKSAINEHELKLLQDRVQLVEEMVKQCSTEFNWKCFDKEVVERLNENVCGLHSQAKEIQFNINSILKGIEKWGDSPFYDRKENSPSGILDLENRQETLKARRMDCEKTKRQLANALEKNKLIFQVEDKSLEEAFLHYLQYIDGLVLNSLKWAVYQNLLFLRNEMMKPGTEPLFEIRVNSKNSELAFSPGLEDPLDRLHEKSETFIGRIEMIIDDISSMAEQIPRVREDKQESFMAELREDEDIQDVKHDIRMCVLKVIKEVQLYVRKFDKYSFLWTNEKSAIINYSEEPKINDFRDNVRKGTCPETN